MTQKIELGKYQELIVTKKTDFGVFLNTPTGEDSQKILLPKAQVPAGTEKTFSRYLSIKIPRIARSQQL